MAREVQRFGEDQIEYWLSQPGITPEFRAELLAEKKRRSEPPNVAANLDAAATPIAPDPDVGDPRAPVPFRLASDEAMLRGRFGPGGVATEEPANMPVRKSELGAYGARFRGAIGNRMALLAAERQAARAAGYQDPEQIEYNEATGVIYDRPAPGPMQGPSPLDPNDPSTWDAGYDDYVQRNTPPEPADSVGRVDRYMNPPRPLEGRDEYVGRLRHDYHRNRGLQQIARYGSGPDRTPEQQARVQARAAQEARVRGTPRQTEAMISRMAKRAGVTFEEAQAAWEAAVADPANQIDTSDGLSPDEVFRGTKALRGKATTRRLAREQKQEDRIELRRTARYNPVAALANDSGLNDWQRMIIADGFLRGGMQGPTPLGVQAVGGQNALAMLRGMNLGQGMQDNPLIDAQAEGARAQAQKVKDEARADDENVLGNKYAPARGWMGLLGYDEFTIEEQQQMYDDLIRQGYTPAEAQRAVDRQADTRRASERADWGK